jgi:hypothetical protein
LPSAIVTSSLTSVGTIATGTWNGTAIGIGYGGTGQATASAGFNALSPITTTGDLIIGNGTNSATRLGIGANTYVLTSNGTTVTWAAPTGGGGQPPTPYTANGVVYASSTSALATGSALQFNGTSLTVNGTASNQSNFIVTAASSDLFRIQPQASGIGVYLQATNNAISAYANMGFYSTGFTFNVGNIGIGGATPTTSGTGITFPATQSASSNANTLDDYETGTFTPTFTSQVGSITSYSSGGIYTKVGNIVYVQFYCTLNNVGTASGQLLFSGFPFTGSTTVASAYQRPFVCRESAATGVIYYGYTSGNSTSGYISTGIGGAITWVNGYTYAMTLTYQST